MTDQIFDEGRRIMALASLRLAEAKARAGVARVLLQKLALSSHVLSVQDLHDFAYTVWAEFRSDAHRAESMPLELEASVFAQAALWLDQATIIRLAREAWGDVPFDAGEGLDRVQWKPEDDVLILTVGHLHSDGSPMQVDMVITPRRLVGGVR